MHRVVKIITNDDGDDTGDKRWHLVFTHSATDWTLCTGEAFGFGDSIATFETKTVSRGGITCEKCRAMIKMFKAIQL